MTKKELTKRIESIVKEMKLEGQNVFSVKELNMIAAKAKCNLYDVMYYLRFCR